MQLKNVISTIFCVLFLCLSYGQDTSRVLRPVPVYAQSDSIIKLAVITSSVPHFEIGTKKLDEIGAVDVGEALKIIPGVQIRDYGGIGGMKSISFRSLGAAHTTVVMDGNTIPNLRSGSINLSQFELFGLEKVSFSSGQVMDELATASAYAQANTIALQSVLLSSPKKMRVGIYTNLTTIHAHEVGFLLQKRLGKRFFSGVQAMLRQGSGQYNFIHPELPEGGIHTRTNTALTGFRQRFVVGYEDKKHRITLSGFSHFNEQELPGAAVLFNPSNDQTLEKEDVRLKVNYLYQQKYWKVAINAGYQYGETRYFDPYYLNLQGFIDARYEQKTGTGGFMLSRSFRFPKEKVFFGSDVIFGNLNGNELLANPQRWTNVTTLGGSTFLGRFKLDGNITTQCILDHYQSGGESVENRFQKISPFLSVGYLPFKKLGLRFRAFYKNTFRMPTFNDLYYNFIGNTGLRPEDASLLNIGGTWTFARKKIRIELTADAYYNHVDNKIVAIPTKDLFNWSMQNIGKTDISGVDVAGIMIFQLNKVRVNLSSNHSFNRSLDVTDPDGITYRHQIPYTPFYSSSNGGSVTWKGYKISLNALISGFRYSLNENNYANYLPGFTDINLGVSKTLVWNNSEVLIDLKAMNILNKNYQVIRSFPMPGRYFQLRIKYNLEK